ncbi:hypothetical protein CFOL_v3_09321 [Cephalotus follicularis]|uniref:Uncharacterized protein n=1 Tax=Cephalotus follicularis TaxID=3775 RepID=A0A1Q3BCP5_CEPFO|nr:hypothetical protein CFOL_v3_09321 [Cephalotus follicularis]
MTAEVDVNGNGADLDVKTHDDLPNGNVNVNGNDDGDASYVFVDDVDPVAQKDLISKTGDVVDDAALKGNSVEDQVLQLGSEFAEECVPELPQVHDGNVTGSTLDSAAMDTQVSTVHGEEKVQGETEPEFANLVTDTVQNQHSQTIVFEDDQNSLDHKELPELTKEIPVEMVVNLETPVPQVPLQIDDVNGSFSNIDVVPAEHTQDGIPDTVVSIEASQITPEQNGCSEKTPVPQMPLQIDDVNGSFSNIDVVPAEHTQDGIRDTFVSVESNQITPEQNECSEHAKSLCFPVVFGNLPVGAAERLTICLKGQLEQKLESNSCPVVDSQLETVVVKGPVSDEHRRGLCTDHTQDNHLETAVVSDQGDASQITPQQNGFLTIAEESDSELCPIDCTKVDSIVNSVPVDKQTMFSYAADGIGIESSVSEGVTESVVSQPIPVDDTGEKSTVSDLVANDCSLTTCSGTEGKPEPGIDNVSSAISRDMARDDGNVAEPQFLNGSDVNSESAPNSGAGAVVVENGEIEFAGGDIEGKTCQEMEGVSSIKDSTGDSLEGQSVSTEVRKTQLYYLIKVPRYDDENLREQIKHAQLQVDQKTNIRDAIGVEVQKKRVTCKEYFENFNTAVSEEKAARDLYKPKRREMDRIQSVINTVKNAMSVEDIVCRIRNMEHMIEHETLPLKEEKQLIREIKQLKQLREQISSNLGKQNEVQQALDQKDEIEERLKFLRNEADSLRENFLKAEAITQAAKKKYYDESDKLNTLQAQFRAADGIRQEAYKHLQSLKKKLYDKNEHFQGYRDASNLANDLAVKRNREELQRLCVSQADKVFKLWQENEEFRKEYIRCNIRSTLWRLRTLDGRSVGLDEEPPIIPHVAKDNRLMPISTSKGGNREQSAPVEADKKDDKPLAKVVEHNTHTAKSKRPAKPAPSGNVIATVSDGDETQDVREEPKLRKEEEELARKAEELRKGEEAAKMKEQRRLEEKAKAMEALERKKRNAEKAQAKAALRAQKEAEQKEKERERRARKKEKRKAGKAEDIDVTNKGESAASSETPVENPMAGSDTRENPAMTKRPQKPGQFSKQTKAKAIPPPLRNRGKRRIQSWMWVVLAALAVFALFLVGDSILSKFGEPRF